MNWGAIKSVVETETAIAGYQLQAILPKVQARLDRYVRLQSQQTKARLDASVWSLDPATGRGRHALPTDYLGSTYLEDMAGQQLSFQDYASWRLAGQQYHHPTEAYQGLFTTEGGYLYAAPAATNETTYILGYYQRLAPLVDDVDENVLAREYPDAYIEGLCLEIYKGYRDTEMQSVYTGSLQRTLEEIEHNERQKASMGAGGTFLPPSQVIV